MSKDTAETTASGVELLSHVERLDAEIEERKSERRKVLQQWADEVCPLTIGDEVQICGYSHKGKRGRITSVRARLSWGGRYEWHVTAVVLKKDGTDSKHFAEFDADQWGDNATHKQGRTKDSQ